jgi:hypothetical protein
MASGGSGMKNGRMKTAGDFLDGYALDLTVWKPDGTLCPESGRECGLWILAKL